MHTRGQAATLTRDLPASSRGMTPPGSGQPAGCAVMGWCSGGGMTPARRSGEPRDEPGWAARRSWMAQSRGATPSIRTARFGAAGADRRGRARVPVAALVGRPISKELRRWCGSPRRGNPARLGAATRLGSARQPGSARQLGSARQPGPARLARALRRRDARRRACAVRRARSRRAPRRRCRGGRQRSAGATPSRGPTGEEGAT